MTPRWVMLPTLDAAALSNLRDIVTALRATPSADDCPDWGQLADCWLDLVRPTWAEHLKAGGRKAGVTRLRYIQKDLLAKSIAASKILDEITGIDKRRNWDERIVACILGVGAEC